MHQKSSILTLANASVNIKLFWCISNHVDHLNSPYLYNKQLVFLFNCTPYGRTSAFTEGSHWTIWLVWCSGFGGVVTKSNFRRGRCHINKFEHLKVRLSESVSAFEVSCTLWVAFSEGTGWSEVFQRVRVHQKRLRGSLKSFARPYEYHRVAGGGVLRHFLGSCGIVFLFLFLGRLSYSLHLIRRKHRYVYYNLTDPL